MLGTCGLFLLLPAFVKLGGAGQTARQVQIMASTLTLCGFFQGPLIPGQQVMRYMYNNAFAFVITIGAARMTPLHVLVCLAGGIGCRNLDRQRGRYT